MHERITFQKTNGFYSKPSDGYVLSPFSFSIDPMEHLILVNFEKDPDILYNVFELQQARDESGRKRLLVIAYRMDGAADIYYQPGFPFASQKSILNDVSFYERPLDQAGFEVSDDRLEAAFCFEDILGREIKVTVNECNRQKKQPFFLLAPVGVISKNPTSLPVYSLYEMSFAKRKYTGIEIEIDHVKHKPDSFPMPVDGPGNLFTRYSADTFNVDWNKNYRGPLRLIRADKNLTASESGIAYEFEETGGHPEIRQISTNNGKHHIYVDFLPAIPDIICLKEGIRIDGIFTITTSQSKGAIRGCYYVETSGTKVDMEIHPDGGWEPNESRWIMKLLFFVVKVFREWPGSYVWNATVNLEEREHPIMNSQWRRILDRRKA